MCITLPKPHLAPNTTPQGLAYAWKVEGYGVTAFGPSAEQARQQFIADGLAKGVFYRASGRLFLVTRVFTDDAAVNRYLLEHPREAVIGSEGGCVYLARLDDHGLPLVA